MLSRIKPSLMVAAIMLVFAQASQAGAVIEYGDTFLGVNDAGNLNFYDAAGPDGPGTYGLWRRGIGDATSPGCECEGWGVAVTSSGSREAAFANDSAGHGGYSDGVFGATSSTATSTVTMTGAPVSIRHAYGPSLAADVFQGQITITNTGDNTLSDVVYRRAMDWDIPPTEFREYVTHSGVAANLEAAGGNVRYASDNGFASSDPRVAAGSLDSSTVNVDFVDNGPADHGSVFDFAFGDLAPGASRIFNIFYGSTANEADALAAIATLGANVYSLGQNSTPTGPFPGTPATFLFAFGGVGGVEPGEQPDVPILPFVPAAGEFVFPDPTPRRWFDPPLVDGFEYTLEGTDPGLRFTEVGTPPASFGFGDIDVFIPGVGVVATLAAGDIYDFIAAGYGDVTAFSLIGIDPLLDEDDPGFTTAFPTFLDWDGTADTLRMDSIEYTMTHGVPEPGTILLLSIGLIGVGAARRRLL